MQPKIIDKSADLSLPQTPSRARIIALTGMPGSGKDSLLKFIEELELNIDVVRPKEFVKKEMQGQSLLTDFSKVKRFASVYMGKAIKDKMQEENVPITSESVREFATNLRKAMGYDIVARLCVPAIEQSIKFGKTVIIEDIKGWEEVKFFRKHFGTDFALVAIHTPPHIRFQRAQARESEWDKKRVETKDEFDFRDDKELGWGLGNAVAMSDYVIVNDGTVDEFKTKAELLFKKLLN